MNDAKQNLTAEEQSIIDRVEAYRKNHPLQWDLARQRFKRVLSPFL
jgi:hypothetical protein